MMSEAHLQPPYETFSKPLCKGSFVLGTACGTCERCQWLLSHGVSPEPTPWAAESPNRPRPYNLEDETERARLLRETLGYARTSLHKKDGTDLTGREFAHDALKHALMKGYKLAPPATQ